MRIELPPPSWSDAMLRGDDDAHTLTLAATSAPEWDAPLPALDPALRLRTEVTGAPATVTLTF